MTTRVLTLVCSPATMTEDSIKTFGTTVPMKRAGQPVEVATCFVFLASADSSYIRYVESLHTLRLDVEQSSHSGQVIHVNGGTVIA